MKKWAHEFHREFSVDKVQMTNNSMKKCSTSLAIKEMQIKTALRFHFTPVRMTIFKNKTTTNVGEGEAKQEPLYTLDGNVS
jgi:hypothetical protein